MPGAACSQWLSPLASAATPQVPVREATGRGPGSASGGRRCKACRYHDIDCASRLAGRLRSLGRAHETRAGSPLLMTRRRLRLGTRRSTLAWAQSLWVAERLRELDGTVELEL